MRKLSRKWKLWGLFFVLMFFAAGAYAIWKDEERKKKVRE